jgi:hypothetical protein
VSQKIPQGQRSTDQEVVAVVLLEILVRLDPLHHLRNERPAGLLLDQVVPQHINIFLLSRDLNDRLDERGFAKIKRALPLHIVVQQILPERVIVAAVDELEDLGQAAHAAVFVREGHATREREPHVFVVECERLEERAGFFERLKVGRHELAPQCCRLVEGGRQRRRKGWDKCADGYSELRKDIWSKYGRRCVMRF